MTAEWLPPLLRRATLLVAGGVSPVPAWAQATPLSPQEGAEMVGCLERSSVYSLDGGGAERLRLAELLGTVPLGSRAFQTAATLEARRCPDRRDHVAPAPTFVRTVVNSRYPSDRNNGVLWGGRGLSAAFQGGIEASGWGLSAALAPVAAGHQNRAFPLQENVPSSVSPFAYPDASIDWPQRFGSTPFWVFHSGESYLRLDTDRVRLGVSSENLWWGPTTRYALLLSNTAPGFPHLSLSTGAPLWIGVGYVEGQLLWGTLAESDYYDADSANDDRFLSGLTVSYQPAFFRGLHLGLSLLLHQTVEEGGITRRQVLQFLQNPLSIRGGNVEGNGMASLFFRWVGVESHLEAYGEWGREDHAWDLNDAVSEPNHSQGWTLGLAKAEPFMDGWLSARAEITNLRTAESAFVGRGIPRWYVHGAVVQGHSNRGQLLGSFVGPGSDAQFLALDWFRTSSRTGVFLERVRWDEDWYVLVGAPRYAFWGHDVEVSAGGRHHQSVGRVFVDVTGALLWRRNRGLINLDALTWDFPWETNGHLEVTVGWAPFGEG